MKKRPSKKSDINLNQKKQSPSISRSITESLLTFIREEKYVLLAALSGVFFFCVMLFMIVQLSASLKTQRYVEAERAKVVKEMQFWEEVVKDRPEYRDGYFMLAVLQYRMGKKEEALQNVQRALLVDPNFKEGREFERLLEEK